MQRIKTENGMLWVISDVHAVEGEESERALWALLEQVSRTSDDVVFLGDIMDLWIGIPRYEDSLHRDFLEWCRREKERRKVYFVEGNHEYYVARYHRDVFFMSSEDCLEINGIHFVHGHRIQGSALGFNNLFCCVAKSYILYLLMSILPFGVKFASFLKKSLGSGHARSYLPRAEIERWLLNQKARTFVIGHFHTSGEIEVGDRKALIVPISSAGADEIGDVAVK